MTIIDALGTSTPTSITVVATSTFDLAAHERVHHRRLLGWLHAPVQQPDLQLGQRRRELGVQRDRGLQLELFRLLDQRTHPVDLSAADSELAHALDDLARRRWLTSLVATGVRPGGISSMTETSRSA